MTTKFFLFQRWAGVGLFGLLICLLAACNEQTAVNAAAVATPPQALTVISVPTATPTASTRLILVPTNTPVEPPPALTEPPQPVAWVRFRDPQPSPADQANGVFVLQATALPTPPAGSHYALWLSQDQQPLFRVGSLSAQLPLTLTNSTNRSWLAGYDGAILSLEPDGQPTTQMGQPVFQGALTAALLAPVRQMVSPVSENSNQQSFLRSAQAQLALAQEHAAMLRTALAGGNLTEGRRHAEHVINILNGKTSKLFGDFDGDGTVQNPGDGVGVGGYVNAANAALKQVAAVPTVSTLLRQQATDVLTCNATVLAWLAQATETALRIIAADSAGEAQTSAAVLIQLLDQVSDGSGNSGADKPASGPCSLRLASTAALDLSSIALYPVEAASTPITATLTAAHDHTATPMLVIEMRDFAFSEPVVIIRPGTQITWVNHGQTKHSATADNGSFDTGLLLPGTSASVTFHKPGVYPYYCALHGGSGGQGMAGRIVVQG